MVTGPRAFVGRLAAGECFTPDRAAKMSASIETCSARLRIADALFTGLHDPAASHFQLLQAFAPQELLERAYAHAEREGYVSHEFGDSSLIARG